MFFRFASGISAKHFYGRLVNNAPNGLSRQPSAFAMWTMRHEDSGVLIAALGEVVLDRLLCLVSEDNFRVPSCLSPRHSLESRCLRRHRDDLTLRPLPHVPPLNTRQAAGHGYASR